MVGKGDIFAAEKFNRGLIDTDSAYPRYLQIHSSLPLKFSSMPPDTWRPNVMEYKVHNRATTIMLISAECAGESSIHFIYRTTAHDDGRFRAILIIASHVNACSPDRC